MEEGIDQKRLLAAVVLSAGILLLWNVVFPPPAPPPPGVLAPDGAVAAVPDAPAKQPSAETPAAPGAPTRADVGFPEETFEIGVSNLHYVELTNRDGQINRWFLDDAQYRDNGKRHELAAPASGKPQSGFLPPLLELELGGELTSGAYTKVGGDGGSVALKWTDPATRVIVERIFTIADDGYRVDLTLKLTNEGDVEVPFDLAATMRAAQNQAQASGGLFTPPVWLFEGLCQRAETLERLPIPKVSERIKDADPADPTRFADGVSWAGVDTRYFTSAVLLTEGVEACEFFTGAEAARVAPADVGPGIEFIVTRVELLGGTLPRGSTIVRQIGFYGGPKKYAMLGLQTPDLRNAVDFGWFRVVSVPMLKLMQTFYDWSGNWGIAIIMLTVLVKLLTLPLTHKQYKSMTAMKKIQPELKAVQEKFKEDKLKLQQEMMKLYREHKVNPLAGCLPMLMMMPVYIALYRTIYSAVELYRADLGLWIHDLSAEDPYYVLPVVLGALMIVQTRLSPSAGDAMQQKMMMYMMPIMFTGMMLFLPSGLVLYILCNTIMGIAQQYWMLRIGETPSTATAKAPRASKA